MGGAESRASSALGSYDASRASVSRGGLGAGANGSAAAQSESAWKLPGWMALGTWSNSNSADGDEVAAGSADPAGSGAGADDGDGDGADADTVAGSGSGSGEVRIDVAADASELEAFEGVCSMCGTEALVPCTGPCGHVYCRHCIARALLRAPAASASASASAPGGELRCPAGGCEEPVSGYSVLVAATGRPMLQSDVRTIFGTSFVQCGCVGFESLHFGRNLCYVSFDASRKLDLPWGSHFADGSAFSGRVPFDEWRYDEEARTFHGSVDYSAGRARRDGAARVTYELHFDEGLEFIASGRKTYLDAGGTAQQVGLYGKNREYLYARVKKSVYESDTTFYAEMLMPWLLLQIFAFFAWIERQIFGNPRWVMQENIRSTLPVVSVGLGSYHFSRNGSFVDFSKSASMRAQGFPSIVPFVRESVDVPSRTFEGVAEFRSSTSGVTCLALYRFVFDAAMVRIVEGEHKFFQVLRPRLPGDVLTQKYSNVARDQLYPIGTTSYGKGHDLQYRRMMPWQHTA